jgi:hypothetical protein
MAADIKSESVAGLNRNSHHITRAQPCERHRYCLCRPFIGQMLSVGCSIEPRRQGRSRELASAGSERHLRDQYEQIGVGSCNFAVLLRVLKCGTDSF